MIGINTPIKATELNLTEIGLRWNTIYTNKELKQAVVKTRIDKIKS